MIVNSFPDRLIQINNETYTYFGGTSYLGMALLPDFQKHIFESLKKWGTFYGSSRNANVKLDIYESFETYFSQYVKAESVLSVSSGTLAGKLVIESLSKQNIPFFHYPNSHPAILAFNSNPLFINNQLLHPRLINNEEEDVIIVFDAILSSEVITTSLDFLREISSKKRITLVVDESHSLGIVGNNGEGIFSSIPTKHIYRKIMISSLGKALGLSGGVIASDKKFIDQLKSDAVYISSSGANPAYLDTFIKSKYLYDKQREKLKANLSYLNKNLIPKENIKFNCNYPVIYLYDQEIYEFLFKENIIIARFKYPTYKNYMNRIVVTANHEFTDLDKLIRVLNSKA